MKEITLTMSEQTKYEIIKSFIDNHYTNYHRLSIKLNSSLKTAYNLVKKYQSLGKEGFSHGNHNKKPIHTISLELRNKIINLYQILGNNINFNHFYDILKRDYSINVSRPSVYRILRNANYYSPKSRKITIKKRNEEIKLKLINKHKLTSDEQDIVAAHLLNSFIAHPRKERFQFFGEMIQMDTSEYFWIPAKK